MENDNLSKIRDLMLARVRGQGGTLGTLLNQWQGAQVGSDRSVMDSYQSPVPQSGYVNTEEPVGPPSVLGGLLSLDPTDYVGPNTLAKLAAGAKGLLSGAALMPMAGGLKVFHGSPNGVDWLINGEKFDSARPPLNMASKYTWANPKQSVAETYAGTSEMQRWKATQGMGVEPKESAGVAMLDLANGRPYKMKDPQKTAAEFGVDLKDPSFLEKMLDKARELGYTHFINSVDGGNVAILDDAIIKNRKAIK